MKITALEGQKISELSMIEVAHALLEQNGKEMQFSEIIRAIQDYLEKSDDEIKASISRFYTEINTDGSFIPLGNNVWALRSWYAIDEIDEEVIALDEIEDEKKKKNQLKNAKKLTLLVSKTKSTQKMKKAQKKQQKKICLMILKQKMRIKMT